MTQAIRARLDKLERRARIGAVHVTVGAMVEGLVPDLRDLVKDRGAPDAAAATELLRYGPNDRDLLEVLSGPALELLERLLKKLAEQHGVERQA